MRGGAALAAMLALAGCGSASRLPPAAGPARSPAPDRVPAGRVVAAAHVSAPDPIAAPIDGGRLLAVLRPRERVLDLVDARSHARVARAWVGVGPTHVAAAGRWLYVVDTRGGALLVVARRPRLQVVRRVDLPGAPYAIAVDWVRHRLWVTLTARDELAELPAHGRPHVLRRLPTLRQPDAVAVDPSSGRILVLGRDARGRRAVEAVDPDREDDR